MQASVKCLCRDILCEDIRWVVIGVYLDDPNNVVQDQLLDEEVFEFNVFGFS